MPSSSSSRSSRGAPSAYTDAGPAGEDQALRRAPRDLLGADVGGQQLARRRRTRGRGARSAASTGRRSRGRPPRRPPAPAAGLAGSRSRAAGERVAHASGVDEAGVAAAPGAAWRRGRPCRRPGRVCSCLPSVCSAGRDHQLGAVELGDVLVAAGRHRGAQAAHQVERAVVLVRGPDRGSPRAWRSARSARARRAAASGGTSPCPSGSRGRAPRGARQRRADHHGVGAAGDRLGRRRRRCACRRRRSPGRTRRSRACASSARPRRRRSPSPAGRRCRARRASCTPRPGPTPTSTPAAPVRIRCRPVW